MNRPSNKGRTRFRYGEQKRPDLTPSLLKSLERFQTMGLRMSGFLHQFKTPLHVIQSQTELLLEDSSLSLQTRASLEMIQQNAARLTGQTQSVMDLARGKFQTFTEASLDKVIEDICQAVLPDCRKKNITLEKEMTGAFLVQMDAVALEGAIHNIVNNAMESMPKGGILRIKTFKTPDSRHVGVEVQDNGAGMDKQTLKKVLGTPFQSTKANGTGLGLYITHYILRRHRASISWDSQPGKGTKVTLLFPKTAVRSSKKPDGIYTWLKSKFAVFAVVCLFAYTSAGASRVPQLLRLKGHFTDSQKVPLTDTLPIHFSVWDTEDGYGNLLWQDVQDTAIQDNTFQVVLGRLKPLPPSVFSGGDRWLEMQIGSDSPLRPRHKIPNQFIQAQVAAVAPTPPPVPAVTVPPPQTPVMTPEEKRDLEMQIEKYKEESPQEPPKPVAQAKPAHHHRPVKAAPAEGGELGNVYTVQNGDTLKSIAQKLYGNAELWYDLYYLNRDRLGPMGHLFPGQILVLPGEKGK